jgi:hypothetical protein
MELTTNITAIAWKVQQQLSSLYRRITDASVTLNSKKNPIWIAAVS